MSYVKNATLSMNAAIAVVEDISTVLIILGFAVSVLKPLVILSSMRKKRRKSLAPMTPLFASKAHASIAESGFQKLFSLCRRRWMQSTT